MGVLHGHELFLEDNDDLVKCLICIYLLKSALTELATESQVRIQEENFTCKAASIYDGALCDISSLCEVALLLK